MCFVIDVKYAIELIQDSKKSVKKHKILDVDTVRYTYHAHSIWTTFSCKYIFGPHKSNSQTDFLVYHARNLQLNG